MRRFRGKSVLVLVTAVLLLGDMFWIRNGIPQLDSDPLAMGSAASVAQAFALAPEETPPAASVPPARRARPLRTPETKAISLLKPVPTGALPPEAPVKEVFGPTVAQARESAPTPASRPHSTPLRAARSPAARLAGMPRYGTQLPAAHPEATLPPRKWSPPAGVAYISWWTA